MTSVVRRVVPNRGPSRAQGRQYVAVAACAFLILLLTIGFGALAPARAQAAVLEEVGTCAASGAGAVGEEAGEVAVDNATGDLYIADTSQHRVTRFNSKCEFLEAWGWGVANGATEYQTCGRAAFEAHEATYPTCAQGGTLAPSNP